MPSDLTPDATELRPHPSFRPTGLEPTMTDRADRAMSRAGTMPDDEMFALAPLPREDARELATRAFDITTSLLLLLLLAPLMVLIAIAVKCTSEGPVLFTQYRVGLGGRLFCLYKFRSMRPNAEAAGAQWATENDPRITPLGRILRRTRFDELPQLFNVLEGTMSLVGPRPEQPELTAQIAAAIPGFDSRTAVRPGITGWAQVNYPYCASIADTRRKLEYDLYYIRNRSFRLDSKILLRTVRVMLTGFGAR
jgi:exopolysaccharide biosynthesis polyprenyl glycosylphosphotransferase